MTIKLTTEVKKSLLDTIASFTPVKHVEGKTYLTIDKLVLSAEGLVFYFDGMPIFKMDAVLNPKRDTITVNGLDSLFQITFE